MEHLPQGIGDEEGCFVYQVCYSRGTGLGVRSALNVGDECQTEESVENGDMVSIDLVRKSRVPESKNGPFLRLSDCAGWLFEKKYGEVVMERIPVSAGLWCFFVDNGRTGIALRRHPADRSDNKVPNVRYRPMQKIYCDRKVQHPSTGINFYRVQGTEGWVFDRRSDENGGYNHMLLDENLVATGIFVYECIADTGIGIRRKPTIEEYSKTDLSVNEGDLICANAIRKSPVFDGNGPYLRLSDGSGWLFEEKETWQLMKRLVVHEGKWHLKVLNAKGIGLRRQPRDLGSLCESTVYFQNETIFCTHMTQSSSGVKFYRVEDTDGWVFDKRGDRQMLEVVYEQLEYGSRYWIDNDESRKGWSPDFVRGIAAAIKGTREVIFNEQSRVISFCNTESEDVRINVYYTTRTVGTALSHPTQGATQLFRRNCSTEELTTIFENPRAHTGKGYKRKRNNPYTSSHSDIILTADGEGLLADRESELRNELVDIDKEIDTMISKRNRVLKRLRETDLSRAQDAKEMKLKMDTRDQELDERLEAVQARIAEEQRVAEARIAEEQRRAQELQDRTCQVCSRVFQNWHAKQQHHSAVHIYRCNVCYREFDNSNSLTQHRNALNHW